MWTSGKYFGSIYGVSQQERKIWSACIVIPRDSAESWGTFVRYCVPHLSDIVFHICRILCSTFVAYCVPHLSHIVFHICRILCSTFVAYCIPHLSDIVFHICRILCSTFVGYCVPHLSHIVFHICQILCSTFVGYCVPHLLDIVFHICWILCSTFNCSMCTVYWNKNISTFWLNGAFIAKWNLALFLEHPIPCCENANCMLIIFMFDRHRHDICIQFWDNGWCF